MRADQVQYADLAPNVFDLLKQAADLYALDYCAGRWVACDRIKISAYVSPVNMGIRWTLELPFISARKPGTRRTLSRCIWVKGNSPLEVVERAFAYMKAPHPDQAFITSSMPEPRT